MNVRKSATSVVQCRNISGCRGWVPLPEVAIHTFIQYAAGPREAGCVRRALVADAEPVLARRQQPRLMHASQLSHCLPACKLWRVPDEQTANRGTTRISAIDHSEANEARLARLYEVLERDRPPPAAPGRRRRDWLALPCGSLHSTPRTPCRERVGKRKRRLRTQLHGRRRGPRSAHLRCDLLSCGEFLRDRSRLLGCEGYAASEWCIPSGTARGGRHGQLGWSTGHGAAPDSGRWPRNRTVCVEPLMKGPRRSSSGSRSPTWRIDAGATAGVTLPRGS